MVDWLSLRNVGWCIFLAVLFCILPTSVFGLDSPESASQVWKVGERRWTIEEENRYSEWVEKNITEDFFIRHDIPVDCADVVYAIRWIYARIAHLPAAATTGDNRLIGHWSTDWGHLPTHEKWDKDRRFRAALRYMLAKTTTRSLPADIYPIRVATDSVSAGTVFLIAESHAGIVRNVVLDGSTAHPIQTFEATTPAGLQKLNHRNFISPEPDLRYHSGLAKFRWPIKENGHWQYLPINEQPYYSEEQYSSTFNDGYATYLESFAKRIDPEVYDPQERINSVLDYLTRLLRERIPIVYNGNRQCRTKHCPDGSRLWHIHSTPGRDDMIYVTILYLEGLIKQNHIDRESVLDTMGHTYLQVFPNQFVTLKHIFENAAWISSDPEATIAARWGLEKCAMIAVHAKTAQDSIAFIRKAYEATDPQFAERSISVRQKALDEMAAEGRKSSCATRVDEYY
jgi:hypothetical protein